MLNIYLQSRTCPLQVDQTVSNRSYSNYGIVSVECQKLRKIFGFEHEFWQGMILTCCLDLEIGSDELKNRWWNMCLNKMSAYYNVYYLWQLGWNGLWSFYLQHSKLVRFFDNNEPELKLHKLTFYDLHRTHWFKYCVNTFLICAW